MNLIQSLVDQGMSYIEAEMEIAVYDLKAESAFEGCNCEVI